MSNGFKIIKSACGAHFWLKVDDSAVGSYSTPFDRIIKAETGAVQLYADAPKALVAFLTLANPNDFWLQASRLGVPVFDDFLSAREA